MIRVLVVDDSQMFRKVLSMILEKDPEMELVGNAASGEEALSMLPALDPDVITLDIEMPGMGGLLLTEAIRNRFRSRILVVSSFTHHGSRVAVSALLKGAHDILEKPPGAESSVLFRAELVRKIRALAHSGGSQSLYGQKGQLNDAPLPRSAPRLVVVGASTGGPIAISELLSCFCGGPFPPVLLVQHMPPAVLPYFSARLAETLSLDVRLAFQGEALMPGKIRIAPGGVHTVVDRMGEILKIRMEEDRTGSLHIPSIDRAFESVARLVGRSAVGVLLSGLGDDGAKGLRRIQESQGVTFSQSPESSAVSGMPLSAISIGAADYILAPLDIGQKLGSWFRNQSE
ncbi:MAG: chemotaxis protein CheB [Leptospirales bacterium]